MPLFNVITQWLIYPVKVWESWIQFPFLPEGFELQDHTEWPDQQATVFRRWRRFSFMLSKMCKQHERACIKKANGSVTWWSVVRKLMPAFPTLSCSYYCAGYQGCLPQPCMYGLGACRQFPSWGLIELCVLRTWRHTLLSPIGPYRQACQASLCSLKTARNTALLTRTSWTHLAALGGSWAGLLRAGILAWAQEPTAFCKFKAHLSKAGGKGNT